MQNDIPGNERPSQSPESRPDPDMLTVLEPGSGFDLWHQPAGTWRERSHPAPLLLLILTRVTALLSTRAADGAPDRSPITQEKVWLLPANTPFSAHWHGPVSIVCLELLPGEIPLAESRIIRLIDLVRADWHLSHLIATARAWMPGGPAETRTHAIQLARYIVAVLRDNENHWMEAGLSTERFRATTDFIEEHLSQKLSRELLAKADGQSLHHFARMFKLRTGLSLRKYIARRRCFRARELIESGERLADAAAAVGFFDQPEMCRKFNDVFGCPPSTFAPENPA